jgi:hypothetical protein
MFHLLIKYWPSDLTLRIPPMRKYRRSNGTVRIIIKITMPTKAGSAEPAPDCRRVKRIGASNALEADLNKGWEAMNLAGRGLSV